MSLGYTWIRADDGNIYDTKEMLKLDWEHGQVAIYFEEYKDNSVRWFTPNKKNNFVEALSDHLVKIGFQVKIGKPYSGGQVKGGRMKWDATIRVIKIPVAVVQANGGVLKGTLKELKKQNYEFTIAAGV